MAVRLAQRGQVPPFRAMDILKDVASVRASGKETFLLCLGQPATAAPRTVLAAARSALNDDALGYTAANGTPQLRERIARHYRDTYKADVCADNVVITTGSSAAFTAIFLAAFAAGDTVAMTRPGYPAYRNTLRSLGCRVRELDCGPRTRWQPSVAQLDELFASEGAPAGLVIASPANPTGTVLGEAELRAIVEWCDKHGTLLISDEIYHGISFGPSFASAAQFSKSNVTVGSFSKYYSMTGWRLGWAVLPTELVRPVELLLGNLNLSAPTLSQIAAVAAFDQQALAELDQHVARYARNRDIVLEGLAELGIGVGKGDLTTGDSANSDSEFADLAPADGAFYCYANVSRFTDDSAIWAARLLRDTGVAVTPGVDFAEDATDDPTEYRIAELDGSRYVRISFAGDTDSIREGMRRLVSYARAGGAVLV